MPNLATALKDEIRRLARKEVRAQIKTLQSASAQYRRDIAALKRQVAEQERQLVRLQKHSATKATTKEPTGKQIRFSPDWVAKHREKLGMSAADYAALIGVSPLTVYNWEHGRSRPQRKQLEAWSAVRELGVREAWAQLEAL